LQVFISVHFSELKEEKKKHLASATCAMMLKHIIFYSSNQFAKANCNRYKLFIAVQFIELIKEKKHLALATS